MVNGKSSPSNTEKLERLAMFPPRPHVIFDESIEKLRLTEESLQEVRKFDCCFAYDKSLELI